MPDEEILDAYSAAVVRVAQRVLPSVASLHVRSGRGEGGGSASVLTADGYLLTSAHVVEGATSVTAAFTDGTETVADVAGSDPARGAAAARVGLRYAVPLHAGNGIPAAVPSHLARGAGDGASLTETSWRISSSSSRTSGRA